MKVNWLLKNNFREPATVKSISKRKNLKDGENLASFLLESRELFVKMPFDGKVEELFISRKQEVKGNTKIALLSFKNIEPQLDMLEEQFDKKIWNVAIASHAAVKGLLAYFGWGGAMSQNAIPIIRHLSPEAGYRAFVVEIADVLMQSDLDDGDLVVVSDKLVAISQNRIVPSELIIQMDPKKLSLEKRASIIKSYQKYVKSPVDDIDLICADMYIDEHGVRVASLSSFNPNKVAFDIATLIQAKCNKKVDVVLSDTDTGMDVQQPLIGCITIGATPMGATGGLALFECMRAALAAEFARGSNRGAGIVIVKTMGRSKYRCKIGEFRGYDGRLSYTFEGRLTYK